MRPTPWLLAEPFRIQPGGDYNSSYGDDYGCFLVRHRGLEFKVIATSGDWRKADLPPEYAWEHVSVSLPNRTPSWQEMDHIKDLFWREDETVVQFHVPKADHKNIYATCLHLWRPVSGEFPRPPVGAV